MSIFNEAMRGQMGGLEFVQQGIAQGEEKRRVDGLRGLMGDYYGKQDPKLGEIAGLGGDAGGLMREQQGQQDRQREQLGQFAALLVNAPEAMRPGLYRQMHPQLAQIIPDAPADYTPEIDGLAQQIAAQFSGQRQGLPAGLQEFQAMTRGMEPADVMKARRVALGLDARPSSGLPFGQFKYTNDQGQEVVEAFDKRTGQAARPGAAAAAPQVSAIELAQNLQRFGGRVTSGYRDPAKNAAVGGVPNSQHMRGSALDVVMPTPQLKAEAKAYMEGLGYQVIDEGDHLHAQAPSGGGGYASRPAEVQAGLNATATKQAEFGVDQQRAGFDAAQAAARAKAEADAKAAAERDANVAKREQGANDSLGLLSEAERLLPNATGSLGGSVRDRLAGAAGVSTKGAQASARLRVIAGYLVAKVPRMEGPQSNFDVQNYKEMAGDLGNEKLPVETRLEALRGMKALQEKYASIQPTASAAPAGAGPKRLKFNPATGNLE